MVYLFVHQNTLKGGSCALPLLEYVAISRQHISLVDLGHIPTRVSAHDAGLQKDKVTPKAFADDGMLMIIY
jgi:hypothetical protein